jgi:NAD(P)-dependent dehydrogenase (short-subunit alcohol dehydrogenase family)
METPMRNAFGLEDRVCVVTGSAGGIGRGIALAFAAEGARVAVLDRNLAGAEETANLVRKTGAEAIAVPIDTADEASVEAARLAVADIFGDADVLVNNAGIIGTGGEILNLSLEDWNRLMAVNLTGYFLCSRSFGKPMIARKNGALVHIVSITALAPMPFGGNYGVAKAGAAMLSHLLAAELAPHGVRSNSVHPGLVQTPMTQANYDDREVAKARATIVPQGRVAQPEDIAQAALFLASPRAAYVNGADLLVDGALQQGLMNAVPRRR